MGSEEDTGSNSNSNKQKKDNNDEEKESSSSSDSKNGPKGPNIPPNPPSDSAINTSDSHYSPKKDEKESDNDFKKNWESHVYQSEYIDRKNESEDSKNEKESKWNVFQFNYQSSQNYS